MRNQKREEVAKCAAAFIKKYYQESAGRFKKPTIGLILGTGWDVISLKKAVGIPFKKIPGFFTLEQLEGHARELVIGELAGKNVCILRGRIHINEAPCDPEIAKMVRLQTEMLFRLGVKKLIITSAVGALPQPMPARFSAGEICVVNGFVTVFAPEMPLWAGEFISPEDVLDNKLQRIALKEHGKLTAHRGGYVMVRGPFFEGRKLDKAFLASTGASVVGMSMLPEVCIAALYKAHVLGLAFVTNDAVQEHSHLKNLAHAKAASKHLSGLLKRIVSKL